MIQVASDFLMSTAMRHRGLKSLRLSSDLRRGITHSSVDKRIISTNQHKCRFQEGCRPNPHCRSFSTQSVHSLGQLFASKYTTSTKIVAPRPTTQNSSLVRSRVANVFQNNVGSLTRDILQNYDPGSMPPEVKNEAIKCVRYWALSRSQTDIDKGGRILLRLMDEMKCIESPERISNSWVILVESFMMKIKRQRNFDKFCNFGLEVLKRLEKLDHTDPEIKAPILRIYNMTLDGLAKSTRGDSIARIEQLLQHMNRSWKISPDASSYNSLLYAHSIQRKGDSAKRCEAVLREMQRNPRMKMLIDTVSYNIVINAWGKSNDTHAANRAEMILHEMQEHYSNGQLGIKPNLVTFTSVISAWSRKSGTDVEAAKRSEDIFNLLNELKEVDEDLRPNAFTFHAVMNAFSKSSLPGTASKAEELLTKMLERYKAGDKNAKPNIISFSICIKTWATSEEKGKSQQAIALLKQMRALSEEGYDTSPDIGIYNSILRALANDNDEKKASKAENILQQIENSNLYPDLTTYNNVLRSCCTTRSEDKKVQRNAVRIATETLLKIQKGNVIPDPYTFNFFIKVCDRLTFGNEKLKLIKVAFLYCTESGQFSPPVLSLLKNALKPQDLKNVLQIQNDTNLQSLKIEDFPKEWSKQPRRGGRTSNTPTLRS